MPVLWFFPSLFILCWLRVKGPLRILPVYAGAVTFIGRVKYRHAISQGGLALLLETLVPLIFSCFFGENWPFSQGDQLVSQITQGPWDVATFVQNIFNHSPQSETLECHSREGHITWNFPSWPRMLSLGFPSIYVWVLVNSRLVMYNLDPCFLFALAS